MCLLLFPVEVEHQEQQDILLLRDNMLHTIYQIKENRRINMKIIEDTYEYCNYCSITMTNNSKFFFIPTKSCMRIGYGDDEKRKTNFEQQYENLEHCERLNIRNL